MAGRIATIGIGIGTTAAASAGKTNIFDVKPFSVVFIYAFLMFLAPTFSSTDTVHTHTYIHKNRLCDSGVPQPTDVNRCMNELSYKMPTQRFYQGQSTVEPSIDTHTHTISVVCPSSFVGKSDRIRCEAD